MLLREEHFEAVAIGVRTVLCHPVAGVVEREEELHPE